MENQSPATPQREAKEIVTKNGHKVMVKTYLTGREANEFRSVVYKKTKFNTTLDPNTDPADNKQVVQQITEMDGTVIIEQQLAAMGVCIISLDGDTKKIVERLQDLPTDDFNEVDAACTELTKGIFTRGK